MPAETERKTSALPSIRYLTVKQFVSLGIFPEGGIRHLLFTNEEFRKKVVRKIGKKILLNLEAIYEYLEEQGRV